MIYSPGDVKPVRDLHDHDAAEQAMMLYEAEPKPYPEKLACEPTIHL
jgi:hypothetical protein